MTVVHTSRYTRLTLSLFGISYGDELVSVEKFRAIYSLGGTSGPELAGKVRAFAIHHIPPTDCPYSYLKRLIPLLIQDIPPTDCPYKTDIYSFTIR